MTAQRFIDRVLDQFTSDKKRSYPETSQADIMSYLRNYSEENLNYLWAGLAKTHSRVYKRLPGIKELEKAWESGKEVKNRDRHPDIDPACEYNPMQIEERGVSKEEAKKFFDKLHNITKKDSRNEELQEGKK